MRGGRSATPPQARGIKGDMAQGSEAHRKERKHTGYVRSAPNKILMDRKQGDKRYHQSPVRKGEGGKVANGSDLRPH